MHDESSVSLAWIEGSVGKHVIEASTYLHSVLYIARSASTQGTDHARPGFNPARARKTTVWGQRFCVFFSLQKFCFLIDRFADPFFPVVDGRNIPTLVPVLSTSPQKRNGGS